jgi:nucleoside-diphosphate-sugar epimerase
MNDGWNVTIIDSQFNSKPWQFNSSCRLIKSGVTAGLDSVMRAMEGVNVVYHLAERHDHSQAYRHPMKLVSTNVYGTSAILAMARRAGVSQVVFTSSFDVYGNFINADEGVPCLPISTYGCSKLAAEAVCRGFYMNGLDVTILRLFNVWGGDHGMSAVDKFSNGSSNIIYDGGMQTRDFIHISDAIIALRHAIEWEPMLYNVGTGEEVTIAGLWKIIRGDEEPIHKEFRTSGLSEIQRSSANMTNTTNLTGWTPKVFISELNAREVTALTF